MNSAQNPTLWDSLADYQRRDPDSVNPPSERIEGKIWERGLYEGKYFDFIAVGTKWIEGCYCLPNAALKRALGRLKGSYKYTLIDSPAGLEHLNRKITSEVDDIFDIIDPSKKSFGHIERAFRITKEIGIEFRNFYVVGGYRFPENSKPELINTKIKFLGKIFYDKTVEHHGLLGKSLLEIANTSPAYLSIKKIMKKANY